MATIPLTVPEQPVRTKKQELAELDIDSGHIIYPDQMYIFKMNVLLSDGSSVKRLDAVVSALSKPRALELATQELDPTIGIGEPHMSIIGKSFIGEEVVLKRVVVTFR